MTNDLRTQNPTGVLPRNSAERPYSNFSTTYKIGGKTRYFNTFNSVIINCSPLKSFAKIVPS